MLQGSLSAVPTQFCCESKTSKNKFKKLKQAHSLTDREDFLQEVTLELDLDE